MYIRNFKEVFIEFYLAVLFKQDKDYKISSDFSSGSIMEEIKEYRNV